MKTFLALCLLTLPCLAIAAPMASAPKPKQRTCKGIYNSPSRTLEVDGKGNCWMAFDNMSFDGQCVQHKDGSVDIMLAGNSFSGKYSADCARLVIGGQTYILQP